MQNKLLVSVGVFLLAACAPAPVAEKKTAQSAKQEKKPAPDLYRVKLETTKGDIVVEVQKQWSPRAAERFYELVQAGYYDEAKFYRVIRGFIAQFGVAADPKKGALYRDLKFLDEPTRLSNKKGTLAFAQNGPHTRSVQVFINLKDNSAMLDKNFPAFAKIVEGMDVAEKLAFVYGELAPKGAGPDGVKAEMLGNAYLEREFPRLDAIKKATIIR
ncbi:MAG: peptidylprolyl isomerase [Bryobacteraceae bacterium]|nr:peptidylprolyl isomerase [Bryobacteraceae bacterium]MDW8379318.1 peptidylprolyl isomerase [Bryobacterales bacterium]